MRAILGFAWGSLLILIGLGLFVWIGSNLRSSGAARPLDVLDLPPLASLLGLGLVAVGVVRLRRQIRKIRRTDRHD